jgi:putative redox protein
MGKEIVESQWLDNMAFESVVNGHKLILDSVPAVGGNNLGPRPKSLMLSALGGCTGMDVVSILKKMRVHFDTFRVIVEGDITEEHPKQFYRVHIIYEFTGKELPLEKIQKAVELSEVRYCGVSATYKKAMEMTSEIRIKE